MGAFYPAHADALEKGLVADLTWFAGERDNERTAEMLQDSGSRWVRLSVGWRHFETAPGVYNPWWLEHYASEFARARAAGQRVLVMVTESPSWASGSAERYAPPRDPADLARFVGFLAERYGAQIDAYEIWNEPNISRFWTTGPDGSEYAALLRASYPAIKRADPTADVVFAGPSTNDYAFVEEAYAAGVKGSFDVMGAHPYSCNSPRRIERTANGRINRSSFLGYREIRASMLANGDDKPMWFTEFGWSTTTKACGVSAAVQAEYLADAYRLAREDPYVHVALWYALRNMYLNADADEVEAQFGLLNTDFTAKPAYGAFRDVVADSAPPAPAPVAPADGAIDRLPLPGLPVACPRADASDYLYPAKMRVGRARVSSSDRRLDVYAPITSRADGQVRVTFSADGRSDTSDAKVTPGDAELARIRHREPVTRRQGLLGTGIVTIRYLGDARTRPQEVRLRAAPRRAELDVEQASLIDDQLSASGSVTPQARGVVRLHLSYLDDEGRPQEWTARARIAPDGSWALDRNRVPEAAARCGGYLSVLFTGYFEQRLRGEMLAYELLPGQTRRP
jgi:hypothetical protein